MSDLEPQLEKIQKLEEAVTRDAGIAHQQGIAYNRSFLRVYQLADWVSYKALAKQLFGMYLHLEVVEQDSNLEAVNDSRMEELVTLLENMREPYRRMERMITEIYTSIQGSSCHCSFRFSPF